MRKPCVAAACCAAMPVLTALLSGLRRPRDNRPVTGDGRCLCHYCRTMTPEDPTRQCLAAAIRLHEEARGAVALATEPVHRLTAILTEHDRLQGQLAELVDRDAKLTGEWLAGGRNGPDPGPADDTRAIQDRITRMAAEVVAARRILPDKELLQRAAMERLHAATAARAAAVNEIACIIASEVGTQLTAALNQALTIEATLLSLHQAMLDRARSDSSDSAGAAHAAERIAVTIRAAKRSAAVPHDAESGRRLLAALCEDPEARLP